MKATGAVLILIAVLSAGFTKREPPDRGLLSAAPVVVANDNRVTGGVHRNDTLKIDLIVQMARWYPESLSGPFVEVPVFAEAGRPPQIPAPLIRVPAGTTIVASILNTLPDSVLWVRGMMTRPGAPDSVPVKPGERRVFAFAAGAPGTYMYGATPGVIKRSETERRLAEQEQLGGAFIVDPPGIRPNDRIFVINIWGSRETDSKYRNALAINGKSWPHTETVAATVGDSVRWRIINASGRRHPMHLHGFYFDVLSRGTFASDTTYSVDARRLAVTEDMASGTTMAMTWNPDRPGNWLFHCHLTFHVTGGARLDGPPEEHAIHSSDPTRHMAGLVLGMKVRPRAGPPSVADLDWDRSPGVRSMRVLVTERPRVGYTPLAMSYVLQRDSRAPRNDSVELPGQPIVLARGEPTKITVVNRAHDGTAIHWHGIELESYSDGVAGWSGMDKLAPMIAPNDSFVARLTLKRAGTFIYHTHLNDLEQITSGMYGPIVVLEPGQTFDPSRDHIFTLGWDGPGPPTHLLINGDSIGSPVVLDSAKNHRLRFVNISPAGRYVIALRKDSALMTWRPKAKDGADLPAISQKVGRSITALNVGETFDVELMPLPRGEYTLTFGPGNNQRMRTRTVIVR